MQATCYLSATASTGYNTPTVTPGTSITVTGNTTVSATTTAKSFNITLNPNGGTSASNNIISVVYNTSIEAYNNNMKPSRSAVYDFDGYYTSTSGGTQRISTAGYRALTSTTYSAAATLYAQWVQKVYLSTSSGISNPGNLITGSDSSSSGSSKTTVSITFDCANVSYAGQIMLKSFYAEGDYINSSTEETMSTTLTSVYARVYVKYNTSTTWSLYSGRQVYANQNISLPFGEGNQVRVDIDTGYGASSLPYDWYYWSLVLGGIK